MPIPIVKNGPNKGEERMRVKGDGYAKPPKLRKKRSDTGRTHGKAEVGEDQPSRERSHRAMDVGPRSAGEPEDYDEDKPSDEMLRQRVAANDQTPARQAAAASTATGKASASVKAKRRKSA